MLSKVAYCLLIVQIAVFAAADRPIAVEKERVRIHPYKRNLFRQRYVVPAMTLLPSIKPGRDDWLQVVNALSAGAATQPTAEFWNSFKSEGKSGAFFVTEWMYTRLTTNVENWQFVCELHSEHRIKGQVDLAIEVMSIYADDDYIMNVLPQNPKLIKLGGYGTLERPELKIGKCELMPTTSPDEEIAVQRRLYPFKHVSVIEGFVEVSMEGIVQANDLLAEPVNPANDNLLNVATKLNQNSRTPLTMKDWEPFSMDQPVGMYIPKDTFNTIYDRRHDFQYKCYFKVPVRGWTSATYKIEAMEVFKDGKTILNVVDQRPNVHVVTATGYEYNPKAEITSCKRLSLWRAKQLVARTKADALDDEDDETDIAQNCLDKKCHQKARAAQQSLSEKESQKKKGAQGAIDNLSETTSGAATSLPMEMLTLVTGFITLLLLA